MINNEQITHRFNTLRQNNSIRIQIHIPRIKAHRKKKKTHQKQKQLAFMLESGSSSNSGTF